MGQNDRIDDIHKIYGWNLTLLSLCENDVSRFDKILEMEFGNIITYLELKKAEEELIHLQDELEKNKLKNV